jgi:hypothetical protein
MAFEIVVRPVIFPNIRPAPARVLAPEDDPKKGICVIAGTSPHVVTLSHSSSVNTSKSHPVETERRVDEVRVYQQDEAGEVNESNFVDIKVSNRITMKLPDRSEPSRFSYKRVEETDNTKILRTDVIERKDGE